MKNAIQRVWALMFLLLSLSALAEDFPASGRVVNPQGLPIAGATVQIAQGKRARQTVTDVQGQFETKLNDGGSYHSTI